MSCQHPNAEKVACASIAPGAPFPDAVWTFWCPTCGAIKTARYQGEYDAHAMAPPPIVYQWEEPAGVLHKWERIDRELES